MILDDMIIKSIEEALAIRVPNDPMIRHRDINPTSHKPVTSNEVSRHIISDPYSEASIIRLGRSTSLEFKKKIVLVV